MVAVALWHEEAAFEAVKPSSGTNLAWWHGGNGSSSVDGVSRFRKINIAQQHLKIW
jgi:hypothetical protein